MADKRTNPSGKEAMSGAGEDDSGFGSNDPTAGQPTSSSTGLETGTPGAKGFVDASRGVSIATQVDNYPEPKEDEEVEVKTTVKTNSGRTSGGRSYSDDST